MNRLARLYWTMQAVGWENVPRRAWHIIRGRLGLDASDRLRNELLKGHTDQEFLPGYRPADALDRWRRRAERFFTGPTHQPDLQSALARLIDEATWQQRVSARVESLSQGRMLLFHHHLSQVGWPVDFNRDPLHDVHWPTGLSRRSYRQFDPGYKDLKCVWEPSRFQAAFLLARSGASARLAGRRAVLANVRGLGSAESVRDHSKLGLWTRGDIPSDRLVVRRLCADRRSSARADRYHRLTELAYLTGRLIEENIVYARSQKNNHAISEALGLMTLGLMFPELRRAAGWRDRGRRIIVEEVSRQIYADGSYVQHSTNYHRVMMDDVLWAICLAEKHGDRLEEVRGPLAQALKWLLAMTDPATGGVPNYGANDGALVLPLSTCDYTDFRPVAQAAHMVLHGSRVFPPGPWDEKMLWLCGPGSLAAPQSGQRRPAHFQASNGGYYTTSGPRSWLFTRIHTFRDRPNQADMLHVDLWYEGVNVLRDGGSYFYYAPPPWQHFFESTAGHNTVEVDGQDQMQRGPSFLWFRWTKARLLACQSSPDGRASFIAGEHYGYRRLPGRVVHRRTIVRVADSYVIIDDLLGAESHDLALRWRLAPGEWREQESGWLGQAAGLPLSVRVLAPAGFATRQYCGQEGDRPEGWESLYYAERMPVPTLVTRGRCELPVRLVTLVGPADNELRVTDIGQPDGRAPVRIAGIGDAGLARRCAPFSEGMIHAAD